MSEQKQEHDTFIFAHSSNANLQDDLEEYINHYNTYILHNALKMCKISIKEENTCDMIVGGVCLPISEQVDVCSTTLLGAQLHSLVRNAGSDPGLYRLLAQHAQRISDVFFWTSLGQSRSESGINGIPLDQAVHLSNVRGYVNAYPELDMHSTRGFVERLLTSRNVCGALDISTAALQAGSYRYSELLRPTLFPTEPMNSQMPDRERMRLYPAPIVVAVQHVRSLHPRGTRI